LSFAGFIIELAITFFIFLLLYSITRRKYTSVAITLILYFLFITSQIVKVNLLGTPIFPADLNLIGDLLRTKEVYIIFLPTLIGFIFFISITIFLGFRKEKSSLLILAPILLIISFTLFSAAYFFNEDTRLLLRNHGIFYKKNANLTKKALQNGLLTGFVQAALFTGELKPPENYSKELIEEIIQKYKLNKSSSANPRYDNVIVMLVESYSDPEEFGWRYSEPILPNYKKITNSQISGLAMSPVYGGKSINAEFELMTGMSNRFTPIETTPYQEFIDRDIPSLARTFQESGYTTNAIQMVPFRGFGFEKIYDYLGVENQISLSPQSPTIEKDPSGRSVSSKVIGNEVISILKSQTKSFVFLFPNSSHSPWKMSHYPNSQLKLLNINIDSNYADTIIAYTEALNHIDEMLGSIMNHVKKTNEKTLIVIAGDHLPGFDFYLNNKNINSQNNYINYILNKYRTSLAIWSSDEPLPYEKINISLNLIPAVIFKYSDIETKGFMKFNSILYNSFDVISHVFKEKNKAFSKVLKDNHKLLINDYLLLQYDLLFGNQYISTNE